jgi:hypothetical protein
MDIVLSQLPEAMGVGLVQPSTLVIRSEQRKGPPSPRRKVEPGLFFHQCGDQLLPRLW